MADSFSSARRLSAGSEPFDSPVAKALRGELDAELSCCFERRLGGSR